MSFEIYTGTWTDWSRGPVLGATITLSSRDASLLLAFIAAFVTIVAIRLWVIIGFSVHQVLATGNKHDGLYYQRQVILRNTKSAPAAAWLFLQQAWYWTGIAQSAVLRTIPLAVFCVLYFVGFTVLAIFSSQISDSASEFRLASSSNCGFAEELKERENDTNTLIKYYYGPMQSRTQPDTKQNFTFQYDTHGQTMDLGYSAWVFYYPSLDLWKPIDELSVPNTDLTLIAIAHNGVRHEQGNKDPVFGTIGNKPERYVSPIACVDRHIICNPNNNECTPLADSRGVIKNATEARLALNHAQFVTVQRLGLVLLESSTFYHAIWTRTQGFLRAQEKVAGTTSLGLPSNQWEIEMASLFDDTMAMLQHRMMEYVVGSSAPGNFETVKVWENMTTINLWENVPDIDQYAGAFEDMCHNQRVKEAQGTLNFSVLGLSLLIGLGTYVILTRSRKGKKMGKGWNIAADEVIV
ncbi:hypothetical protein NW752_011704 [Fusarium irregulare]|nr:hypothetical protein NW752_011704 [Fusarium irregulare]